MNRILACVVTFFGIMLCNVATAETTTTVDEHSTTVVKPLKPSQTTKSKKVKAKKSAAAKPKKVTHVDEQHSDSHSTTLVVPAH